MVALRAGETSGKPGERPGQAPPPSRRFLVVLCLVAVAVLAFYGYLRTGATTSDDLVYEEYVITGRLGELTTELATGAGRFHHYLHVGLTALPDFLDSLPARKAAALAVFLAAIASLSFVAARIAHLPALGALTALGCLAFYQDNWHHNILTSYPLVFDSGLLCMVWAGYCLLRHGESDRAGWLTAANILALAAYCHFEAFVCYIPILCGIVWLTGQGGPARRLRTMALASAAFPVYVAVYLGYRWLHPSQYEGNALDLSSPLRIAKTVVAYSQSAFPLGAFHLNLEYVNRFPGITTSLVLDFGQYLSGLCANWPRLSPSWLALAGLTGGLTYHLLATAEKRPRLRPLPVLLAVYAVYCPNFLIALSPKYQEPTTRGIDWYVTSTFSAYAVAMALALAGLWLADLAAGPTGGRRGGRRVVAGVLALLAAGTALVTASVNASVLESKIAAASRWRAATLLAQSPALAALPDGALLVAPDLFEPVNVELTGPGYWDAFLARRTGRQVHVIEALDPAALPAGPFFALRRLSGPTDSETSIALARVTRLGPPNADAYAERPDAPTLFADRVDIATDATNRYYDVLYQDGASWRLAPAQAAGRRGLAETVVTGHALSVSAMALVPAGSLTASVPSDVLMRFGEGFSPPERAITGEIVWAGNAGELTLENRGPATTRVRLDFTLIALAPVALTAEGPGSATATIASSGLSTPVSLPLALPAGTTRLTLRATPAATPSEVAPGKRFGVLGATLQPEANALPAAP